MKACSRRLAFGSSSKTEETKGMPLPQLNRAGELPGGVHQATIDEVLAQFGAGQRNDKR